MTGPSRRLGVVVNPTAGKGRAARLGRDVVDVLRAAGHAVHDLSGPSAALALERARAAVDGGALDALVVVGGDGMVHLGAQVLSGTQVPLGIVAVGTGNDFAHTLGLPVKDPTGACADLCRALGQGDAGVRAVDVVHASGPGLVPGASPAQGRERPGLTAAPVRWVAGAVSVGLDAAVNARANTMLRPRGSARYTIAALHELAGYRAWSYRLTFEELAPAPSGTGGGTQPGTDHSGHGAALRLRPGAGGTATWSGRAALVTAANGPRLGGGIRVVPTARVDDGYLDVLVATDLSRAGAAVLFPSMFAGAHTRHRKVHVVRCRAVTIEPGPDAWAAGEPALPAAHGDGERLGPLPLKVAVRTGALHVLTTRR
ncbi:diacylglycerol kinase [Isoptericola sp. NEAU-Y5]|uniref:Diacylglycerol kinase n=1 Tax=Isoptericola luteus TaxID=2879484 RepID=A0ABS7ZJS3_9MICO|nr:diacylglycerol kinase family protein [Isoptericola sp. NEAU-Y5]MCA5894747.1 diacylglycerol kinase [Isoptericola sp. NEAU-Y5]